MTYYIFGGSGFIGGHLIDVLREEFADVEIVNLDLVENNHEGRCRYVYCDVREKIDVPVTVNSDEDVVVNLAAVHRTPGHKDIEYFETNIRGARNIADWAEIVGIKRMVFTSSIAPYAASEEEKYEDTLPTPNTPYGISKFVAEEILRGWQKGGEGRELTILRPGVVFGKGEGGNFTRLYWAIRKHRFAFPGRRDTVKACVYVKDLVHFILYKVAPHNGGTELYNCTYEPAYTIGQIVESMKKVTGLKSWTPLIPTWILMAAAYVAQAIGSPMGICPERVRKLMISTNICGKKMSDSGYVRKYTFEEAIEDWLKDSGGEGLK